MHRRIAARRLKEGKLLVEKGTSMILEVLYFFEKKFDNTKYIMIGVKDIHGNIYVKNHRQVEEL